jgi:hypothetical protein
MGAIEPDPPARAKRRAAASIRKTYSMKTDE